MILPGLPSGYGKIHIINSILANYNAYEDEIIFIRRSNGRSEGLTNWLKKMPVTLAKGIVLNGGLSVGFKNYILRPYTHIQKMQAVSILRSPQATIHQQGVLRGLRGGACFSGCNEAYRCINCFLHNRLHRTCLDLRHKSSDPTCETYLSVYTEEREHLDGCNISTEHSRVTTPTNFLAIISTRKPLSLT